MNAPGQASPANQPRVCRLNRPSPTERGHPVLRPDTHEPEWRMDQPGRASPATLVQDAQPTGARRRRTREGTREATRSSAPERRARPGGATDVGREAQGLRTR
jgi:hypothetical protein